jgi:hypothetical protein
MEEVGTYKIYTDDLTAIFDTYEEIIYMCNKFDIKRIDRFLIYTIENYDFYIPHTGNTNTGDALSNSKTIGKSSEYTDITEDIQKDFDKIIEKCDELGKKIDRFLITHLENQKNKLITDNFKSQFNRIDINLKNLVIELEKIKAKKDSEIDSDISFNIYPITKSNMIYNLQMYGTAKMIFKNLHIINSNESEPTADDLEGFNKELNNINKELIKKFNNDIVEKNQKKFEEKIELLNESQSKLKKKFDVLKDEEEKEKKEKERKGDKEEDDEEEDEGEGEGEQKKEKTKTPIAKEADDAQKKADEALKKADDAQKALVKAREKGGDDIETAEKNLKLAQDAVKTAEAALVAARAADEAKKKAAEEAARLAEEEARLAEEAKKKAEEDAAAARKKAEEDAKKKEEEERKKAEEANKNKVSFTSDNIEHTKQDFDKLVDYLTKIITETADNIWGDAEDSAENKTLFIKTARAKLEDSINKFNNSNDNSSIKSYGNTLVRDYNVNCNDLLLNKSKVVAILYIIIICAIQDECAKQDKQDNEDNENKVYFNNYEKFKKTIIKTLGLRERTDTYDGMINYLRESFIQMIIYYINLKNSSAAPGTIPPPPPAPPPTPAPSPSPAPAPPAPTPEEPKVFNFKYDNNSCYVHSLLQMILDNDDLCKKINDKKVDTEPTDKSSSQYLLYLLQKLITYHKEKLSPIGESKIATIEDYTKYIEPLRYYFESINTEDFGSGKPGDPIGLLDLIIEKLMETGIKNPYDCPYPIPESYKNLTYSGNFNTIQNYNIFKQLRLLLPTIYNGGNGGQTLNDVIDICMKRHISEQEIIFAENTLFNKNMTTNDMTTNEPRYTDIDYIEPPKCKTLIISTARIVLTKEKDLDDKFIEKVNDVKITLSKELKLPYYKISKTKKEEKPYIIKYRLQGFIYYYGKNNGGHYTYFKSLSPNTDKDNDKWVELNDLGDNNGKRYDQSALPSDRSVLYYYTKVEESSEQDQNIVALPAQQQDDKVAAGHVEPVEVANTTTMDFKYKYSFEKVEGLVNGNTPIYNGITQPYYSNSTKDSTKNKKANFMASLNAGDEDLYVGGGFINKAFNIFLSDNKELEKLEKTYTLDNFSVRMHLSFYMEIFEIEKEANKTDAEKNRKHYLKKVNTKYDANIIGYSGTFHTFEGGGLMDSNEFKNNPYYAESYLYISEQKLTLFKHEEIYPGDVFIDILKYPPLNYEVNKAMIYCVGPRGLDKDAAKFIEAVEIVGKNIANAIFNYNNIPDKQNIDYARICLISGGDVFRHSEKTPNEVAEALIKGIHSVNSDSTKQVKDIVYNFAYADGAFQTAFNNLKSNIYNNDTTFVELTIPK